MILAKIKKNCNIICRYLVISIIIVFMLKEISFINGSSLLYVDLLLMVLLTVLCLLNSKNYLKKEFITKNIIPIVFLVIQLLIFLIFRLSVTTLSLFFNEFFYLFVLYVLLPKEKNDVMVYYKTFVIASFIMNVVSVICCYLSLYKIIDLTTYATGTNAYVSGIFSNPNGLGIITSLSLMLFTTYFFKKDRLSDYLFILFSILVIYVSGCRTALLILFVYGLFYIVNKYFKKRINTFIKVGIILLITTLTVFFGYIYINRNEDYLNKYETKLDSLLTHRYTLSKYSVLSLENDLLVGIENNEIATRRYAAIPKTVRDKMLYDIRQKIHSTNNNHNGYTQVLVNFGLIIFILYLIVIIKGILLANYDNVAIIFSILMISFFEGEICFAKNVFMVMFILILGYREVVQKRNKKKGSDCHENN